MNYEEYYADRDRCLNDLNEARSNWGHSEESDLKILKTLGIMKQYCPISIHSHVDAAIDELNKRILLCKKMEKVS